MLKTNVRQNPITHHKSPFANALIPGSLLLTPVLQENEGATGDVVENKRELPKSEAERPPGLVRLS